ncbi:hypothetical protein JCM10449v2_001140 [Rhodotorula kratochvilovae]
MPVDAAAVPPAAPSTSSPEAAPAPAKRSRADTFLDTFTSFRAELDAHHAQRERIVKLSRDVTALSKQLIFTLHRVGSGRGMEAVFREAEGKMQGLRALFEKLQGEVKGADFWRYERSVSPGIQEYLEGFTFFHYLEHRTLPTLAEAQASLFPPAPAAPAADPSSSAAPAPASAPAAEPYFHVTIDDYLGGVADLTGELMRLAIASVGKNLSDSLAGGKDGAGAEDKGIADIDKIGRMVREIQGEMTPLAAYARWLPKKLQVLDQSLAKIENASYNLRIRGAECQNSPAMLQALARKMADSAAGGVGGREEHFKDVLAPDFNEGTTTTDPLSTKPSDDWTGYTFDDSDEETDSFSSVKRAPQVKQDRSFSPYKRVKIRDTCFTTYQAVLLWLQTGHIVFAPLRSSFLHPTGTSSPSPAWTPRQEALRTLRKTKDARLPPPASPKSVYCLADLLSLDELNDIAGCYAPVRDAIVDYVVDCWDEVRDMPATHETEGRAERDELPAGAAKTAMLLARRLAERAE